MPCDVEKKMRAGRMQLDCLQIGDHVENEATYYNKKNHNR
jgi:hypothetical protein